MADKKNIVIKVSYPATGSAEEIVAAKTITVWNVKRIMIAGAVLIAILIMAVYLFTADEGRQVAKVYAKPVALSEKMSGPKRVVMGGGPEPQVYRFVEAKATEAAQIKAEKPEVVARVGVAPVKQWHEANEKSLTHSAKEKRVVSKQSVTANKITLAKLDKNVSRALLVQGVNGKEPTQAMAGVINVSKTKPVPVYYFTELKAMSGKKVYHQWLQNGKTVAKYELPVSADRWRTYSHRALAGKARGHWLVKLIDEKGHVLNEQTFMAK